VGEHEPRCPTERRRRLAGAQPDTAAPSFIFRLDKPKLMKMAHEEEGRI
jgi:hypothetical protein